MSDRELLALAAKAAGVRFDAADDRAGLWAEVHPDSCWGDWDPLADDGDALRLAVKLKLDILFTPEEVEVIADQYAKEDGGERVAPWACENWTTRKQDPYAATRRAIVRAAADIGRNMK